jgi:hypothetical protein
LLHAFRGVLLCMRRRGWAHVHPDAARAGAPPQRLCHGRRQVHQVRRGRPGRLMSEIHSSNGTCAIPMALTPYGLPPRAATSWGRQTCAWRGRGRHCPPRPPAVQKACRTQGSRYTRPCLRKEAQGAPIFCQGWTH